MRTQPFDTRNIFQRPRLVERLSIASRKCIGVLPDQAPTVRGSRVVPDRARELVLPCLHQTIDAHFQFAFVDVRRRPIVARDDVLRADKRPFHEKWIDGGDAAVIDLRQQATDAPADHRARAVTPDKYEHRHEAIEAVHPHKHARARPQFQIENARRPVPQLARIDLQ